MFSLSQIQEKLHTRELGRTIEYIETVDSTNTRAWELIQAGRGEGTLILTNCQTSGRGRSGRRWFSRPGKSLTFSLILKPHVPIENTGWYSLLTGVAVAEALERLDFTAGLKWPNDIVIGKEKLGGILCETRIHGHTVQAIVIGVGINVNETVADLQSKHYPAATSLLIQSGRNWSRETLLAAILNRLEPRLDQYHRSGAENIKRAWLAYCGHLQKEVFFVRGSETVRGIFKGLGPQGEAQVETDGKTLLLNAGEIHGLTC